MAALAVVGLYLVWRPAPRPPSLPALANHEPHSLRPIAVARLYDVQELEADPDFSAAMRELIGNCSCGHEATLWRGRLYILAMPDEQQRIANCLSALKWLKRPVR